MDKEKTIQDKIDEFHNHLDKCQQCENNPFNLCQVGAKLMEAIKSEVG